MFVNLYTRLKITTYVGVDVMPDLIASSETLLKQVLDKVYEGLVVIDNKSKIVFINEPYLKFLDKKREDIIGKKVVDVIDNTKLHIVASTGKEQIGDVQEINGKKIVAMRIPVYEDGKIIGAIGRIMFKDLNELDVLSSKVHKIEHELDYYKNALKEVRDVKYSFDNIIGESNKLKGTKYIAEKAALTSSNVLIYGESGTGKELFAHAIHSASYRAMGPFVKVNCGAIPSELLESELFGYEEGAFTGAKKGGKIGKFELADGGSIFLDEIGDMPLHMQVKLLRAIQEKVIERVGGIQSIELDVRIIAATNKDLEKLIEENKFREDLYYRLNVMNLNIPPLRERKEDIEPLINHLLVKISEQAGNYVNKISKEALRYLERYSWPGNVRELENILERTVNLLDYGKEIQVDDLPIKIKNYSFDFNNLNQTRLKDILDAVERKTILDALEKTGKNKSETAKMLDISRTSLYEKIWKYGIE